MRIRSTVCFLLLGFTVPSGVAAQVVVSEMAPLEETKARLSQDQMDVLVAKPMTIFESSGLAEAEKAFDQLLAKAVNKHGQKSVEQADLLTAFGVGLYVESFNSDDAAVGNASLDYLKRAIPAYKAAFGARDPEVALALNSYADAAMGIDPAGLRPDAVAALEEALAIRVETLGRDNPETRSTADKLENVRNDEGSDAARTLADLISARSTVTPATSSYWRPDFVYTPLIDDFLADADRLDAKDAAARKTFAAKYGLSVAGFDETLAFLRDMDAHWWDDKRQADLRRRALRLVDTAERAPIALAIAAAAIDQTRVGGCTASDVGELMQRSHDKGADLWRIAATCSSTSIFAKALAAAAAPRPAILYASRNWGGGAASELAAADMLLRPEFLEQVDEAARDEVRAEVARDKLKTLLDYGLLSEAIAFGDSLGPKIRKLALTGNETIRAKIGGVEVKSSAAEASAADYAAALALAGRAAEARSVLDLVAPAAKLRDVRSCLDTAREKCDFGRDAVPLDALIVDQLLTNPEGDPYILAEADVTQSYSSLGGGVTEAYCRVLSKADERDLCKDAREALIAARTPNERTEDEKQATADFAAAQARAFGPEFEVLRAAYAAKLEAIRPAVKPMSQDWSRESVDPAPVPFRKLPLPAEIRANGSHASHKGFANLPQGFSLVRVEGSGERAAAISLSSRLDPNGEVSAGGYWLHLSDDGGKTWQPPLYTGLAEYFPYSVPEQSDLPMFDGKHIRLEVEEALIDTASITYPPVGTEFRRKRKGIYLDIPIAELRKDSNGDGITDIEAHHLLLDSPSAKGTPFIVGTDKDCSGPSAETLARLEILKALFKVNSRAIIEPVGVEGLHLDKWRRTGPSAKPPIFLVGKAGDYQCVAMDRLTIVYSEEDRERLRKFSPDFQLIDLPAIHWNRAHTRGFVSWSMGWTGGTYRLVHEGEDWKLESISQWIS